jgi:hypothetical protein
VVEHTGRDGALRRPRRVQRRNRGIPGSHNKRSRTSHRENSARSTRAVTAIFNFEF